MKHILTFLGIFLSFVLSSQSAQIPFTIEIQPVNAGPFPGMHSFAFAQSGSKWLFVGGRTNGVHGFSTNDNFDVLYASDVITVIDTATWSVYSSPLGALPTATADPLRATNAQYAVIGNYLYITGGFGWDSTANGYRTFPKLTAIHIDNMINAVINGTPIAPHIRQITDNNLRICGGEMEVINGDCYLFFGHNFYGRYSDPPAPTFTQVYSNELRQFTIVDDGTNLSISNYSAMTDTNNFHRRDLNVGPVIHPDGTQGVCVYSGVFRKDRQLPYTWPIAFDPVNGVQVDSSFTQYQNNYTCPLLPVFDSVQGTMYTVLFGGCSQYDYDQLTGFTTEDTLVPFVEDISVLVHAANGAWAQVPLSLRMPGLQGANMLFVPVNGLPRYSNDVTNLRQVGGRILAGYLVGGIVSATANWHTNTWANDTIYRVYLTPDANLLHVQNPAAEGTVDVFPNPSRDHVTIRVHADEHLRIAITDATGRMVFSEEHDGVRDVNVNTSSFAAGIYFVDVVGDTLVFRTRMVVQR